MKLLIFLDQILYQQSCMWRFVSPHNHNVPNNLKVEASLTVACCDKISFCSPDIIGCHNLSPSASGTLSGWISNQSGFLNIQILVTHKMSIKQACILPNIQYIMQSYLVGKYISGDWHGLLLPNTIDKHTANAIYHIFIIFRVYERDY